MPQARPARPLTANPKALPTSRVKLATCSTQTARKTWTRRRSEGHFPIPLGLATPQHCHHPPTKSFPCRPPHPCLTPHPTTPTAFLTQPSLQGWWWYHPGAVLGCGNQGLIHAGCRLRSRHVCKGACSHEVGHEIFPSPNGEPKTL